MRDLPVLVLLILALPPPLLFQAAPLGFQLLIPEAHTNDNYDQTTSQERLAKM